MTKKYNCNTCIVKKSTKYILQLKFNNSWSPSSMDNFIGKDSPFHLREDLWYDVEEYKEDYKEYIKRREYQRLSFMHRSTQIKQRKELIEYLKFLAVKKRATYCCLHLSVYLLDIFMDNHSILLDKLYLVANVCFFLAVKMEGSNEMLKINDLNKASGKTFSHYDYKALEILILNFFNWSMLYPTAATYTHYYMQSSVSEKEIIFLENIMQESARSVLLELHNKMRIYLDKIIDDIHFMQYYTPSKLAASVVAAARLRLGLNSWSSELNKFTGYSIGEIEDCLNNLLRLDRIYCDLCDIRNF